MRHETRERTGDHTKQGRAGRSLLVIAVVLAVLPLLGVGCKKGIPADVAARLRPVRLVWWGVNETEEEVAPIIEEYRKVHPNVSIEYRRFRYDEYENRLLNALAEGDFRGPDIFSMPSSWSRKYASKLLPAPQMITMPFQEVRGSIKKEVVAELRTSRSPAPQELPNMFVDVVAADAILPTEPTETQPSRDAIFGLPMSVDTLVLYANRDLLNAAGIPEPARTWEELQVHIPRLTKLGASGEIVQSGIPLGTPGNIQRSVDILSLLMMQNGVVMATNDGVPTFNRTPASASGAAAPPGVVAVEYFTDFANPQKLVYTWNASQPDSLEAFLQGRVAYFFGYSYHLPIIKARAPRINLSVTGVPHIAAAIDPATGTVIGSDVIERGQPTSINYANVWLQTVSERTRASNEAWDAVLFMTTRRDVVQRFLARAQRPTALRSLIPEQLQDPTLKAFANQLLTARTWYRGRNVEAMERAMGELMEDVLQGRTESVQRALQLAAQKVQQTL